MQLLLWPSWLRHQIYAAMLAALFAVAFIPGAGEAAGHWHIQLHLAAFAVVGVVSCWAWPTLHWRWHLLLIAVIALAHEYCEIFGHGHHLELNDVGIDILGGVAGVVLCTLLIRAR